MTVTLYTHVAYVYTHTHTHNRLKIAWDRASEHQICILWHHSHCNQTQDPLFSVWYMRLNCWLNKTKCQGNTIQMFIFQHICLTFLDSDSRDYNPLGKLSKIRIITAAERVEFPDSNSLYLSLPTPYSLVYPPLCYDVFGNVLHSLTHVSYIITYFR